MLHLLSELNRGLVNLGTFGLQCLCVIMMQQVVLCTAGALWA